MQVTVNPRFTAFPGILRWQDRMWSVMKIWIDHQRQDGNQTTLTKEILDKQESIWSDARNFYLKGVTFGIHHSQHISVAISKMQGLTNALKVFPILV
jgi:leucyl-tRNA synthetase